MRDLTWYGGVLHRVHGNEMLVEQLSSNLLTLACTDMKLSTDAYYVVSMTTIKYFKQQPGIYFFTPEMVALVEMKLGTHAYDIVFMTIKYCLNNNK